MESKVTVVVTCIIRRFNVPGVRVDVLCIMQIRNPVVCDTGQSSLHK